GTVASSASTGVPGRGVAQAASASNRTARSGYAKRIDDCTAYGLIWRAKAVTTSGQVSPPSATAAKPPIIELAREMMKYGRSRRSCPQMNLPRGSEGDNHSGVGTRQLRGEVRDHRFQDARLPQAVTAEFFVRQDDVQERCPPLPCNFCHAAARR